MDPKTSSRRCASDSAFSRSREGERDCKRISILHYIFLIILSFHVIASLKFKQLIATLIHYVYFVSSIRQEENNQRHRECLWATKIDSSCGPLGFLSGERTQVVSVFIFSAFCVISEKLIGYQKRSMKETARSKSGSPSSEKNEIAVRQWAKIEDGFVKCRETLLPNLN